MKRRHDRERPAAAWPALAAVMAFALAGCGNLSCDTAGNAHGATGDCGAHVKFLVGR
jgi:hypothetical protein